MSVIRSSLKVEITQVYADTAQAQEGFDGTAVPDLGPMVDDLQQNEGTR
jgi:hypothetical protein